MRREVFSTPTTRLCLRPFWRVETPPGAQGQVDWGEFVGLDRGDGPQALHAIVLVLSHSRQAVLTWSARLDQLNWHHAHNKALRRLVGAPAVRRIDNLETGVVHGARPRGEVNPAYRAYARAAGFHIDAWLPRRPEHKGKVESEAQLRHPFSVWAIGHIWIIHYGVTLHV